MEKILTTKQYVEIYDRIVSEKLLGYTCQFFEKGTNGMKPYGSGVFVIIHGVHFIFTASHVVNAIAEKSLDLFIPLDSGKYIKVLGTFMYTDLNNDKGIDLAYIKLDDQMIPDLNEYYNFLPIDKVRKHDRLLVGGANYCVVGFPENNREYIEGELVSVAEAYFTIPTNDKPYKYYKLSKEDWIIVNMTGKSKDIETKEKLPINTHLHGISGCGLWLMMPNLGDNSYDYRLIGIMTDIRNDKFFCLIGNKIHHFIEALIVFEKMEFNSRKVL